MVEGSIEAKRVATHAKRKQALAEATQDPSHDWIEKPLFSQGHEELWRSEWTFPRILRGSLLISIASHVEHVLREWCELLDAAWSLTRLRTKAPRGTPEVLYCMGYVKEVAGLAVGDFEQWDEWKAINAYKTVRDCLAHHAGVVSRPEDQKQIDGLPEISVEDSKLVSREPSLAIGPGACEAAAENARKFFERLTEICQQDPRAKQAGRTRSCGPLDGSERRVRALRSR
jgi:hypothetical protein